MDVPRYPQIRIACRSCNPLVLVAEVREAMRRARIDRTEIQQFSDEALATADLSQVAGTCRRWVELERRRSSEAGRNGSRPRPRSA
jgi:hypothetical protein